MVFDGSRWWYRETDVPRPILAYGRTKAAAESLVLAVPGGLVARISLLFGPSRIGREGFYDRALGALRAGQDQSFFEDEYRTPIDYATAARVLVALCGRDLAGIVHVAGRQRLSRHELMSRVAQALDLDASLVRPNRRADVALSEPRPEDLSLETSFLDDLFPDLDRPVVEEAAGRIHEFEAT
jgi:dTDP-4-dehydrorhamnose reductase